MTVKQRFLDVSSNSEKFWKKSLKVTRQWSEVTRPLYDCQTTFFWHFKQFENIFKKVAERSTRQWSEVTRPLYDCQTTFFWHFKQFENFLKKVAEQSRDSGRRSRGRWPTVKQRFFDVSSNSEKFRKKSLKVTRQWSEVTRPLADCQTTFFDVASNSENFWKKSLNGHAAVVGGHATVGRLLNNVFSAFQAIWKIFEKSPWTVTRVVGRSGDCRLTVRHF